MNEAEFEARMVAELRVALPWLQHAEIAVQHTLTLRLGHHKVLVDGHAPKRAFVQGRLDALITYRGEPLLLIELKAPNVALEDADVEQALSYARLLPRMPPLALVTNGSSRRLIKVHDGSALAMASIDEKGLNTLLASTTALAVGEVDQALKTLLGRDGSVWAPILRNWSRRAVKNLTGPARDLRMPIVEGFHVPRSATTRITQYIAAGATLVALTGAPLGGKTNVLAEIAMTDSDDFVGLFVDASQTESVLQYVANLFAQEFFSGVSPDSVRTWLYAGLRGARGPRLVLIVDGLRGTAADQRFVQELNELVEFASDSRVSVVVGLGSDTYDRISRVSGRRTATRFGSLAAKVSVGPLTDAELNAAEDLLSGTFGAHFVPGLAYSREMRLPWMMRSVLATLSVRRSANGAMLGIPPIVTPALLRAAWQIWVGNDAELADDLERVAEVYLAEAQKRHSDIEWQLATHGRIAIGLSGLETALGHERVSRLRVQGYLALVRREDLGTQAMARVEELLGWAVSHVFARQVHQQAEVENLENALEHLVAVTERLPLGDVIAACAVLLLSTKPTVFEAAVQYLLDREPREERVGEGAKLAAPFRDGTIRLHFGKGMDEPMLADSHPWLILSQVVSEPLSHSASLLAALGSCRHFLRRIDFTRFAELPHFSFVELGGVSVVEQGAGIVEPVTQALFVHAHRAPSEFVALARLAVHDASVPLAWRILTVAHLAMYSADEPLREAAEEAHDIVAPYLHDVALAEVSEDGAEHEDVDADERTSEHTAPPQNNPKVGLSADSAGEHARRERNARKARKRAEKKARRKNRR
ncbi:type I restriction enzyme HsdR N-terminal domain-containing protein [Sorangium sp. So ce1182]|uniref:type I restriction enzyme HsdR N-terminal domain-containing protein n=1 Tax=Sorangium sp. So ce1182 TaxID=3133334 RepID=UPI003F5DDC72